MNISNRINFLLFCALACVSITNRAANTTSANLPIFPVGSASNAQPQMGDALLQVSARQLSRLDQIAEHLARLISDHQINAPITAMQACTTTRSFIKELLEAERALQLADEATKLNAAAQLVSIAEAIAANYKQACNTTLKVLKPFGIAEYKKLIANKQQPEIADPAQLLVRLSKLDAAITRLDKLVENIGLTWYNKLARKIDNTIIIPIERNNLGKILAISAASIITSWYLIGEYGENLAEVAPAWAGPFINKAQTSWGKPIPCDSKGNIKKDAATGEPVDIHADGYTWRSRMVYSLKKTLRDPLTLMALGSLSAYAWSAWDEIKSPFVKTIAQGWNKLRGGAFGKAKVSGIWNFEPTHTFDKVIGLESVKAEFSVLLEFLKNPESAIRRGLIPAKAYLLTGAPGVGKTFAVEALCGEIDAVTQGAAHSFRFMKLDAPMIHEAPGGIKTILDFAQRNAPCVIFIDEIDLLGLQRTGDNKLLMDMLTSMGNTINNDPNKLVVLVAASNKPEMLDKALLRTGRFKEIRIEHPTFEARTLFLRKELSSYGLDPKQFAIEAIAQETDKHTIEDLRSLIRRGIITSWMLKVPLNQTILDYGMNKEVHHIMLEDQRAIPVREQKLLAAYFAGRALALNIFDTNEELAKVTIKPVMTKLHERTAWQQFYDKSLKDQATMEQGSVFTMPKQIDSLNMQTKQELLALCKAYLAGTAAQELLLNNSCVYQDNPDHDRAFICAQRYVLNGLDPEKLSTDLKKQYQNEAHVIFMQCKDEVKAALSGHTKTLQALASALEEHAILGGNEVKAIIELSKVEAKPKVPGAEKQSAKVQKAKKAPKARKK